jgi:hypothetical protein
VRAFILPFVLLTALSLAPAIPARAQATVATAAFAPARPIFLSSEHPWGTLRIHNVSLETLAFQPYAVTQEDVSVSGAQAVPETNDIYSVGPPVSIAPGATYEDRVSLTACTILSDPCSVSLALEILLDRANGKSVTVKTAPRSYRVVGDPTATFAGGDLRGNRPLFVAQGEAADSVFPDVFVVEFHAAASEPQGQSAQPPLLTDIQAILSRDGVSTESVGAQNDTPGWSAVFTIPHASEQRTRIASAISDVNLNLASRIASVTHHFTVGMSAFDALYASAREDATRAAKRFSEVLQSGALSSSFVYGGTFLAVGTQGFAPVEFGPDTSAVRFDERPREPVPVRAQVWIANAGAVPAMPGFLDTKLPQAEYAGLELSVRDWPKLNATIEADRPELYVTAAADEPRALAAGRDPGALAFAYARSRAGFFASLLGARTGIISMVVIPKAREWSTGSTIDSIGLAMTMDAPTTAPNGAPPDDAGTRLRPVPAFGPIAVAGPESAIAVGANAGVSAPADATRMDVAVNVTGNGPDPGSVKASLMKLPLVSDVSTEGTEPRVGYDVVLRSVRDADRARVVGVIRSAYGATAQKIKILQSGLIQDCRGLERRVLASAIASAREQAAAKAKAGDVRLRRLLLAVAAPLSAENDACFDRAESQGLRAQYTPQRALGDLRVWEAVSLTFRTTQ